MPSDGSAAPSRRTLLKGAAGALAAGMVAGCTSSPAEEPGRPRPVSTGLGRLGLPLVPARRAEDLVQHYAVNTKFRYASAVYGYTDAVLDLVAELGVRTVRERISTDPGLPGTGNLRRAMPVLAGRHGVRWHPTCLLLEDIDGDHGAAMEAIVAELTGFYAEAAPDGDLTRLLHSLGGPNEINGPVYYGRVHPRWYDAGRTLQTTLWDQARIGNARWEDWVTANGHRVPVAGPSTRTDTTAAQMRQLGDLTGVCELANAHLYQRGVSPSKNVDAMIEVMAESYDGYPLLFTEAGYNNSPQTNAQRTVPEWVSNIYAPRAPCDFFRRDAVYFRFELLDDPDTISRASQTAINASADNSAHFGMVAMTSASEHVSDNPPSTWRKKPEFHTMRRWIGLLSDRHPRIFVEHRFTPAGLRHSVSGATPDVHQLLVQKHDGRHYLLLWRDVDVFDPLPTARVDLRPFITPVPITLRLEDPATVRTYKPAVGGDAPTAQPLGKESVPAGGTLRLSLDYHLHVVEIEPTARGG